jgi:hypothetical protein
MLSLPLRNGIADTPRTYDGNTESRAKVILHDDLCATEFRNCLK